MSVRGKVAVELGIIAMLTTVFLVSFPIRSPAVDVGLAAFALACIGFSAGYTRKVIWVASPSPVTDHRLRRCLTVTFWVTAPAAFLFLAAGAIIAFKSGGWPAVANRIVNWRILAAFGCYLPWALMQQALLQFYLLGRLLALFPGRWRFFPMLITGICFGLVHLPDVWTALATVAAGTA